MWKFHDVALRWMSCLSVALNKGLCYLNTLMALAMMKGALKWPFKENSNTHLPFLANYLLSAEHPIAKFKSRRKLSTSKGSNGRTDINIDSRDLFEGERTDFASAGSFGPANICGWFNWNIKVNSNTLHPFLAIYLLSTEQPHPDASQVQVKAQAQHIQWFKWIEGHKYLLARFIRRFTWNTKVNSNTNLPFLAIYSLSAEHLIESPGKFKSRRKLSTSNGSNGRKDISIYPRDLFEGERTDCASAGSFGPANICRWLTGCDTKPQDASSLFQRYLIVRFTWNTKVNSNTNLPFLAFYLLSAEHPVDIPVEVQVEAQAQHI
ncbi:hypothetical protein CDAR_191011 [Caerostris darwini]|uniref:Uncharacterized protein n=1 Tax=Caerostris darwini TaxID=1538125 RepID=A0AAV4VBU2_9ARAC|nr:hypothetical protein CDAR_191011 [Caerostris darwini]